MHCKKNLVISKKNLKTIFYEPSDKIFEYIYFYKLVNLVAEFKNLSSSLPKNCIFGNPNQKFGKEAAYYYLLDRSADKRKLTSLRHS